MTVSRNNPLPVFFAWVFALSVPFWLLSAATGWQLLPDLSVSALMTFCPAVAASILVYRERGHRGVTDLLRRSLDYARIRPATWFVAIFLLMPAAMVATRWLISASAAPSIPIVKMPLLFIALFVGALGEELGWSGYAVDRMQRQNSALPAAVVLGAIWAAWHIVPLLEAQRPAMWIAWWCLFTVATRVLIVWIYNNAGRSVVAAALYHAVGNVCTIGFARYYDPRVTGLIIAIAAAFVTLLWGPRTFTRFAHPRFSASSRRP